jgi:uncharacterized membrane protein YqhA
MTAPETEPPLDPLAEGQPGGRWLPRVLARSRFFVLLAVLSAFVSAVTLYVYGSLVVLLTIWETATHRDISIEGAKDLQVRFIELTDVFLLGTVLVIVAFGLDQLFLHPGLPVPEWLRIRNLDQLTARLIEVVGVLLGVTFLAFAVEIRGNLNVLEFGGAIAIVIAALSLLLVVSDRLARRHGGAGSERGEDSG